MISWSAVACKADTKAAMAADDTIQKNPFRGWSSLCFRTRIPAYLCYSILGFYPHMNRRGLHACPPAAVSLRLKRTPAISLAGKLNSSGPPTYRMGPGCPMWTDRMVLSMGIPGVIRDGHCPLTAGWSGISAGALRNSGCVLTRVAEVPLPSVL